jgi:putative hydrolase of the HAD superfamily
VDRSHDAVLFDFSGVMVTSAFDAFGTLAPAYDMTQDELTEFLLGPYDQDTSHPWHRAERGEITIVDWAIDTGERARQAGFEFDFGAMASVLGALEVYDQMVNECRRLRAADYKVALLTNNIAEGRETWSEKLPLDELFDVVVDSSAVGIRKPNPAIYHLTLERLGGVEPRRAIFLDDHPGNIAGAELAGLDAILVGDPDVAIADLRALLG